MSEIVELSTLGEEEESILDGALVFADTGSVLQMDPFRPWKRLTFNSADGTSTPNIDARLYWALNEERLMQETKAKGVSIDPGVEADIQKIIRECTESLPQGLEKILRTGRLRLVLLFNHFGSNISAFDALFHAQNAMIQNGGETLSMVNGLAYSGPGLLTFMSDRSTIIPHASVMVHAENNPYSTVDLEKQMEVIRRYVLGQVDVRAHAEVNTRFDEAIADPSRPFHDVFFTAAELDAWATAELLPDISGSAERFTQETGLSVNCANWRNDPIACHFLIIRLEEHALLKHGVRMKFFQPAPGQNLMQGTVGHGPFPDMRAVMEDLNAYRKNLDADQ